LLDRDPLEVAGLGGAADAEERADAAGPDVGLAAGPGGRPGVVAGTSRLVELPELLLERHAPEQRVKRTAQAQGVGR
jgi:hypothetical protein